MKKETGILEWSISKYAQNMGWENYVYSYRESYVYSRRSTFIDNLLKEKVEMFKKIENLFYQLKLTPWKR